MYEYLRSVTLAGLVEQQRMKAARCAPRRARQLRHP